MNNKQQAIAEIEDFLQSNDAGLLITGTNQYKKHILIMAMLNKYYKNKHILFRINAMMNISDQNFTPLKKQPKAGERVKLGNNYYYFDAFTSSATWSKTVGNYDFAIVYPIDSMCRENKMKAIEELFNFRAIGKTFFCSWTDVKDNDYTIISEYYNRHIIYDAADEDLAYHNRVLEIIGGQYQ
ncbi:hypothetical protein [Chakrabartyella piscis]|uniref:hypothetical protein n=1 Tax=Chakrabartyella piscis TaxID=2918914 RepID=UPI002958D326|nr:hypothetical protein [Chakrabartyella piscis]